MLIVLLIVSTFLAGLIWVMQCVHYPSFRFVNGDSFKEFHFFHTRSITFLVAPLMIVELVLIGYLAWIHRGLGILELYLLVVNVSLIWGATFFIQVPLHQKLSQKKDSYVIKKLVMTNWIRTVLWTINVLILLKLSLKVEI